MTRPRSLFSARPVQRLATLVLSAGLAASVIAAHPEGQVRAVAARPMVTWTSPTEPTVQTSTDAFSATWTESGSPTASRQSQWWGAVRERRV